MDVWASQLKAKHNLSFPLHVPFLFLLFYALYSHGWKSQSLSTLSYPPNLHSLHMITWGRVNFLIHRKQSAFYNITEICSLETFRSLRFSIIINYFPYLLNSNLYMINPDLLNKGWFSVFTLLMSVSFIRKIYVQNALGKEDIWVMMESEAAFEDFNVFKKSNLLN